MSRKIDLYDTGGKRALYYVFRSKGGLTKTGLLIGMSKQNMYNYTLKGKVPILNVAMIAKALKVSPYLLNYTDYCKVTEKKLPWDYVVINSGLSKSAVRDILALEPPMRE